MNAILVKDERSEFEAFCEAIVEPHGTSICREEEIVRNKREANRRKWEARLRRASGCDGGYVRRENGPPDRAADPAPLINRKNRQEVTSKF